MPSVLTSISQVETLLLNYSPLKMDGESYTLGRMQHLMQHLGNPQDSLKIIQVAGTSGKTSTAYFIRNVLEQLGKKTGLTASPHIASITERVQISGQPLSDEQFVMYLNEFLTLIDQWPDIQPTYFELLIAFAYWVFAKEKVEYAVVEVGLGGLLDATNVVSQSDKVCVLTPIGLDHTQVLGSTLQEIAYQKAGIISANNHVFSAKQDSEVAAVFALVVSAKNATMHHWHEVVPTPLELPFFQQDNWHLANQVTSYVTTRDRIILPSEYDIIVAMRQTPPGRYEKYQLLGKTIILDGAHNPQKLQALKQSLRNEYNDDIAVLAGFIGAPDHKIDACFDELTQFASPVIMTEFQVGQDIKHRKSISIAELQKKAFKHDIAVTLYPNPSDALDILLQRPERVLVVTGSLYLVAIIRPLLREK